MPVPNSFANVTTSIPLSQLDANFNTPITLGNTAIQLGNTVTTLNNMTLANVTISSGNTTVTSETISGNLTFTGTGNRILGDFSNATVANRVVFQTSTVNSSTVVTSIPNGTGTTGGFFGYNNSDPTNSSFASVQANSGDVRYQSGIIGTGTYLPMTFYTGGSEAMRIDTSRNVGIGVTPSGWTLGKAIEVGTSPGNGIWGVGTSNMNIVSNVYYDGAYKFAGTGSAGTLAMSGGGFSFASSTASGTAGGTISFTDILGASRGNTLYLQGASAQSGTGITFPATQNASSNANTLDDYEEGTWTPTLTGNTTYTIQSGTYIKVGRMVTVWFDLQINVLGTGSVSSVAGLPFTSRTSSNPQGMGASVGFFSNANTNFVSLYLRVDNNSTTMVTAGLTAAAASLTDTPSVFKANTRFTGTLTYEANA
jgi:hypothetical protein